MNEKELRQALKDGKISKEEFEKALKELKSSTSEVNNKTSSRVKDEEIAKKPEVKGNHGKSGAKGKNRRPDKSGERTGNTKGASKSDTANPAANSGVTSPNLGTLLNLGVLGPQSDTSDALSENDTEYFLYQKFVANQNSNPIINKSDLERFALVQDWPQKVSEFKTKTLVGDYVYGGFNNTQVVRQRLVDYNFSNIKSGALRKPIAQVANVTIPMNIDGYIPNSKFKKIKKMEATSTGYSIVSYKDGNNRVFSTLKGARRVACNTANANPASNNTFDIYNRNGFSENDYAVAPNSVNSIKYNASKYGNSFNADIDSHNYFASIRKIIDNISLKIQKELKDHSPAIVTSYDFMYSFISDAVQCSTFLYIMLDSLKGNFDWATTLAEKTGIVDNTVKYFMGLSSKPKRDLVSNLNKLLVVFDHIPVNKEVVNMWHNYKNAAKFKNSEAIEEDNVLLIPHFKLKGDFSYVPNDSGNEIDYITIRANASVASVEVPYGSPFRTFFTKLTTYLRRGVALNSADSTYSFGGKGGSNSVDQDNFDTMFSKVTNSFTEEDDFTISNVRMTADAFNFLRNVENNMDVFNSLLEYIDHSKYVFKYLHEMNAFDGTIFSMLRPSTPDLFTYTKQTYDEIGKFRSLLSINTNFVTGYDLGNGEHNYSSLRLFNDNADINVNYDGLTFKVLYSQDWDHVEFPTMIKGIMIDSDVDDATLGSISSNSIAANLVCVNVTNCILLPFDDKCSSVPGWNVTTPGTAEYITFTKLKNQKIYSYPVLFEFSRIVGPIKDNVNASDFKKIHFSNSDYGINDSSTSGRAYYYTSDKLNSFSIRGNVRWYNEFIQSNKFYELLGNFRANTISYKLSTGYNIDNAYGYFLPSVSSFQSQWTTTPFSTSSLEQLKVYTSHFISQTEVCAAVTAVDKLESTN